MKICKWDELKHGEWLCTRPEASRCLYPHHNIYDKKFKNFKFPCTTTIRLPHTATNYKKFKVFVGRDCKG